MSPSSKETSSIMLRNVENVVHLTWLFQNIILVLAKSCQNEVIQHYVIGRNLSTVVVVVNISIALKVYQLILGSKDKSPLKGSYFIKGAVQKVCIAEIRPHPSFPCTQVE